MAKKKKQQLNNGRVVVKKSGWSVFSIFWGVLVFGLLIPALLIAVCLDIDTYKKEVWAHVEGEKKVIGEFNSQLELDINKLKDEITSLEQDNVRLQAEIAAAEEKINEYKDKILDLQ